MTEYVMIDGQRIACAPLADGRLVLMSAADPAFGLAEWQPVTETTIVEAGVFQELFPAGDAPHGGYVINLSPPGTDPIKVDPTGAVGSAQVTGAMPIYPAMEAGAPPGAWRVPPGLRRVTIRGPAGAVFRAFYG